MRSRVETPAGSTEPMGSTGPLAGQVIFIDPGHGGYDPGACGKKYLEKDIVLNVGLLLGVRLEKSGAEVIYSRTGDYSLWTEEIDDRDARTNLIEKANPTIIISLHCNAFTDPYEYGAQVFYNSSKHPDSQKLAELIQDILKEETGTYREISSKLDHFILNHSDGLAVTVELGFFKSQ